VLAEQSLTAYGLTAVILVFYDLSQNATCYGAAVGLLGLEFVNFAKYRGAVSTDPVSMPHAWTTPSGLPLMALFELAPRNGSHCSRSPTRANCVSSPEADLGFRDTLDFDHSSHRCVGYGAAP